jgi:glucuronosyltransferase
MQSLGYFDLPLMLWFMGESLCHHVLQQESIQKLIHSTDLHFDVVIVDAFFNECFLGFAHKFQAPIIQVCAYGGGNAMAKWVGNPNPYSYVPDEFLDYTDQMNFWERTHNTFLCLVKHVGRQLIHVPKQNAAMQKHFNYTDNLPPVWELEHKTSLVLLNTHHSLSYPKPLMPNYVQVGGMHINPPKKLPKVRRDINIGLLTEKSATFAILSIEIHSTFSRPFS